MELDFPTRSVIAIAAVLAFLGGALMLSGCGGDASTAPLGRSAQTSSRASAREAPAANGRARFIAQADAICARANRRLSVRSSAAILKVVPHNIAVERKANSELHALTAPQAMAPAWRRVLDIRRELTDELVKLVKAARRRDTSTLTLLVLSKKQTHGKLLAAAQPGGFKDCAKLG